MITKGKLTDQILRLYTGGNPSDDREISRADIDLLVGQVVNLILMIMRNQKGLCQLKKEF